MDTMTDTPETDNEADDAHNMCLDYDCQSKNDNIPTPIVVPADFARNLERERDELRAQLREEQQLHIQTLGERDEARQWESQALVARIQRDEFSKTLGEVREILCDAMPNENAPTSFMAATLVKERDEARGQLRVHRCEFCNELPLTETERKFMQENDKVLPPAAKGTKMNPEQQRIAIAEACGYYLDTDKSDKSLWWLCRKEQPNGIGACKSNKHMCWEYAPDYLNDLNAMHEAEKMLDDEQDLDYSESLELVVGARWSANNSCDMQRFRSATAAQRAEAFLKTLSLWTE